MKKLMLELAVLLAVNVAAGGGFKGIYYDDPREELRARRMDLDHGMTCNCSDCMRVRCEANSIPEECEKHMAKPLPRYDLLTGINVAIKNVQMQGSSLSVDNVVAELERMQRRNDVALPYSYDVTMKFNSSGKSKVRRKLNPAQAKSKAQMEQMVANVICGVEGEQTSASSRTGKRQVRFPINNFLGQKIGAVYNAGEYQGSVVFDPPEKISRLDRYVMRLSSKEHRIIRIGASCAVSTRTEACEEQAALRKQLESYFKRSMETYEDRVGNVDYSLGFNIDETGNAHREILLCISELKEGGWEVSMGLYDNDLFGIEMENQ